MVKVRRTVCLAGSVVVMSLASWPGVAQAGDGVSAQLCSDPNYECTVSVDGRDAREVSYSGVDVTGKPGTRVRLAAYYVRTDNHGKLTRLERFVVADKPVVVGDTGIVGTSFGFPTVQDDPAKIPSAWAVSYTHLTLPTKRIV